jgi:hypothetical protein
VQWVDATRKNVVIEIERDDGMRSFLVTSDRQVIAAAPPLARGILAADGTPSAPGPGLRAVAIEALLDLFFVSDGRFTLRENVAPPEPGVPVEVQIGFLVMEALRQLDEWPRIEAEYPDDSMRLRTTGAAHAAQVSVVQREILRASEDGRTLGEVRVVLGLSRNALLRRVDELRSIGLVSIEGSVPGPDLPATLLEQAKALMLEEQFIEAAYVLRALLATSPGELRLRRLLDECEKRHLAACYAQVSPSDIVQLSGVRGRHGIAVAEQALVDALAQKPRSVAGLVLVSPLREIDTMVGLLRLTKKGIVEIDRSG